MGFTSSSRVLAVGAVFTSALAAAAPATAGRSAHARAPAATYVACIELTGAPATKRDLKLRVGSCHRHEQQIAWPPASSAGGTGQRGPTGPAGTQGAAGQAGATGATDRKSVV